MKKTLLALALVLCLLSTGALAEAVRSLPEDETILATVRAQIRAMNERAGREKYFFL